MTGGEALSHEFKDLIQKIFSYDPALRPTIEEVKNHPWMQNQVFDHAQIRLQLQTSI